MPIVIVFPSQNTINSFPVAIYPDGRQVALPTAYDIHIAEQFRNIPLNVINNNIG